MTTQFRLHTYNSLSDQWAVLQQKTPLTHIFTTPEWCRTWWDHFGTDYELFLGAVYIDNKLIGISPLKTRQGTATFLGSTDVCDYLDFVIEPGRESTFFTALLAEVKAANISTMNLSHLRPDSTVVNSLINIAHSQGFPVSKINDDVSLVLHLPSTWEEYLTMLSAKQRHELKRKLRRISETGTIVHRTLKNAGKKEIDIFVNLFKSSREDKAAFLTPDMELFFRELLAGMAEKGYLKLNFTELDNKIIASTICFEYQNTVYLYNSGFDREYNRVSAGLISKALTIKDSIERNIQTYDFLRGNEDYKYHLGGTELPLYSCTISIR
jgi:CelD/BcsL family acetyltransferase involved in cellulose biosynthesis